MISLLLAMVFVFMQDTKNGQSDIVETVSSPQNTEPLKEPRLTTETIVEGLENPWDIAFLPDGTPLVNERSGEISLIKDGNVSQIFNVADVYDVGEGGLTGMALDSDFATNRYLYTCFNSSASNGIDVRLVRWTMNADNTSLGDRTDIVTGMPSNQSGRHSGCRVKSAADGTLWIGTGDAAKASTPQDPNSLGGKILHVTRDGKGVEGNQGAPFDARIFSYGHRNIQGIALFDQPKNGVYGYSVEHGSDIDDEINLLTNGNFGWAPKTPYIEDGVSMTDLERFPDAVSAVWSSGDFTIAPSGASILRGENWGLWNGAVAMAVLKDKHVRIMRFDENNKLVEEKSILGDFGRIRSATLGPDGALYLTTDNSKNDKVVKVKAEN